MNIRKIKAILSLLQSLNNEELKLLSDCLEKLLFLREKYDIFNVDAEDTGWRTLENDTHVQFGEGGSIVKGPKALQGAKFEKNEKTGRVEAKKPDGTVVGWEHMRKPKAGKKETLPGDVFKARNVLDSYAAGTVIKVNGETFEKRKDNFTEWINTETGEVFYGIQIANSNLGAEISVDDSKPKAEEAKKQREQEENQKKVDAYWNEKDTQNKIKTSYLNATYDKLYDADYGSKIVYQRDGKTYCWEKQEYGYKDLVTGETKSARDLAAEVCGYETKEWGRPVKSETKNKVDAFFVKEKPKTSSSVQSGELKGSPEEIIKTLSGASLYSQVKVGEVVYFQSKPGVWQSTSNSWDSTNTQNLSSRINLRGGTLTTGEDVAARDDYGYIKKKSAVNSQSKEEVAKDCSEKLDKTLGSQILPEYGNAVKQMIQDADEDERKAFAIYADEGYVAGTKEKNCAYQHSDNKVHYDAARDSHDPRGAGTILFHETGHYVDYAMGKAKTGAKDVPISDDEEFAKAIKEDFDDTIKRIKKEQGFKTKQECYDYLAREASGPEHNSESDIYGACSGNKTKKDGCYGHLNSYWKDSQNMTCEAFAHFYAESVTHKNKMSKSFPKAYKRYKELMKGAIE